jgi:hypothetical protein
MAGLETAFDSANTAWTRTRAQIRALRVLNALVTLRVDPTETAAIGDLELPPEATLDPFNREPLKIKHADDGWIVYSVGENLADDGGAVTTEDDGRPLDVGVAP